MNPRPNWYLLLCFLLGLSQGQAQGPFGPTKELEAVFAEERELKLDGKLDEGVWNKAPIAKDFVQNAPFPNTAPSHATEVKVIYTREGIWIGARMYDTAPDSILRQLSIRDEVWSVNTDYFGVRIDAMYTRQNSFRFVVTAAGVELDEYDGDAVWDAVWSSAVAIDDLGWTAEIAIPYSQLRFPPNEEQRWGINFERSIRRFRERSFWSPIDPALAGEVQQYGILRGIKGIKPPIRLSLTPYAAGYLRLGQGDGSQAFARPSFSAGTDLRYGLTENFTLDLALIPDFGDVLADDLEFNISPFEIYYAERRPFFTEGVDLFNRGGLFYSRRVGDLPSRYGFIQAKARRNGWEVLDNPDRNQLINALKISGRTKDGLGLGVFNAITAASYAVLQDSTGAVFKEQTQSLSNYSLVVADQQLGRNSFISLVNSSVIRQASFTRANVLGTEFKISDKKNRYAVSGRGAWSYRDLDSSLQQLEPQSGFKYLLGLQKIAGNWRFNVYRQVISQQFNINDLGFITATNFIKNYAEGSYYVFKPFGIYNNMRVKFNVFHEELYEPRRYARVEFDAAWSGTFRNFLSGGLDVAYQPWGYVDYFEARTLGQPWRKPVWGRVGGWLSSDYRKPFALDARASFRRFFSEDLFWQGANILELSLSPRFRFNDYFNMVLSNWVSFRGNNIGYATRLNGEVIFGSRYRQDMENVISANYLFNNRMNLSFRLRHYWALVDYSQFYTLDAQGNMLIKDIPNRYNTTYNAFNIDLIYRWRFLPGSELNLVWKNIILRNDDYVQYHYGRNLMDIFDENQVNQFSIKVLYFVDYFQIEQSLKRRRG